MPTNTAWFAIPGNLQTPTGGYRYAREILRCAPDLARDTGVGLQHLQLPGGFPFPSETNLKDAHCAFAALPSGASVLVDGLALGAMDPSVFDGLNLDLVAMVHHPLASETGLSPSQARELKISETTMLAMARHIFVPSPAIKAELIKDYAAQDAKISVALPGLTRPTSLPDRQQIGAATNPFQILSVGSISPRKGHDVLLSALAMIKDLDWTARIVGGYEGQEDLLTELKSLAQSKGIGQRVTFCGALSSGDLEHDYRSADLFALLTRYEGFGMVFAEAMAWGLPVVAAAGGAVADTVPDAAGAVVPVDDVPAAAEALRRLITNPSMRHQASSAALHTAQTFPDWPQTTSLILNRLAERS